MLGKLTANVDIELAQDSATFFNGEFDLRDIVCSGVGMSDSSELVVLNIASLVLVFFVGGGHGGSGCQCERKQVL